MIHEIPFPEEYQESEESSGENLAFTNESSGENLALTMIMIMNQYLH